MMEKLKIASIIILVVSLFGCGGGKNKTEELHSTIPYDLEKNVDIDTQIFLFFNKPLRIDESMTHLLESDLNTPISGLIDVRGATLIFTPSQKLKYDTNYYFSVDKIIKDKNDHKIKTTTINLQFTTKKAVLPTPDLTYTPGDSISDVNIAPSGEIYTPVTDKRAALHAKNHSYTPLITATIPSLFEPPAMDKLDDFVLHKEDLVVVNPGLVSDPVHDEFLWIMEGKRHGYKELTVVLTNTPTGNGAPLHTHTGEESHVLLEGKMRYFMNDEEFTVEAPYIINIPAMAPHAFMNIGDNPAKLVGIFPASNKWEYDVLDKAVFLESNQEGIETKPNLAGLTPIEWLKYWHQPDSRKRRLKAYKKRIKPK